MKLKRGSTSVRRLIFIADATSTTGGGLANLTSASAGLVCWYFAGDLSNDLQVTLVSATLGSFTSGGFVAVDDVNMPGWYEIGIPNAALDGGNEVCIQLRGAANMVPVNIYIELDAVNYQDASSFGLSRLDVATSTRLAAVDYVEPSNGAIADIADVVSNIQSQVANLQYDGDGYLYVDAMAINGSSSSAGKLELFAANGVAGGSGHVHVATLPVDAIGSTQLAASAISEIQSGLATTSEILAVLQSGSSTPRSPVAENGKLTGPIIIGDSYLSVNARAFTWLINPVSGVNVATVTCKFGGIAGGCSGKQFIVDGTVEAVSVDSVPKWKLVAELQPSDTANLPEDKYRWSVALVYSDGTQETRYYGDEWLKKAATR